MDKNSGQRNVRTKKERAQGIQYNYIYIFTIYIHIVKNILCIKAKLKYGTGKKQWKIFISVHSRRTCLFFK